VEWIPFHPGVDIRWLYREDDHGPSAALIRFQPGASVPLHEHRGYEHIYILSGSQSDGSGLLAAGSLMVHPPGTRHRIDSQEGCLVLAIYEKPAQFVADPDGAPH
jgi:anti-sigma factor ChrR (cupin superfamily)